MIPLVLVFLVFLMVPLRLSATELPKQFGDEKNPNASASAAAASEHERQATETDENDEENITSSLIDPSGNGGGMDGITRTPSVKSFAASRAAGDESQKPSQKNLGTGSAVAIVTSEQRQRDQISSLSRGSSSLQKLDGAAQARVANIKRVRSQASELVQKAKTINPEFASIIDEWHQSDDPETRGIIINTQILAPNAPEEELEQRTEIAGLLQQAAQMEESVAQMEQVGIDETWRDAEMIAPAKLVQVPSQQERAALALQNLERDNQITAQAVNTFIRLITASKTRVCLSALNWTMPMSPIVNPFMTANQGADWENIPLILNNGEPPVCLIIPASEGQSNYTLVTPTIIPAGARTIVNGVTTTAPRRVPTAEENRQVRRLINEALQVDYGPEVSKLFPNFDQDDAPLMAGEISEMFVTIEEEHQESEHQNKTAAVQHPQIPLPLAEALVEHSSLAESDEVIRQKDLTLSNKAHENLDLPNKANALGRAALHAGETVARSAGVVAGTIAGVAPKTAAGAAIGAVIGGGIVTTAAGVAATGIGGGIVTALAIGTGAGLSKSEIDQAFLGSGVGIASGFLVAAIGGIASMPAVAASMIGGAIIGGAALLAYDIAPAAAQRALKYCAPSDALAKAREALNDWSGASANHALEIMQEAQATDLEAMEALHDLFESFAPVENAAVADQVQQNVSALSSSSSASSSGAAVEETKADERAITLETLTPARARDILIGQIKLRIRDREDLMTRLQKKMEAIAERERQTERQGRAVYFNPENKARHGGRRI